MMETVLISGATGSLGRQAAIDLVKSGARVIALGRTRARLSSVASFGARAWTYEELNSLGTNDASGLAGGVLLHFAGVASRKQARGDLAKAALRHAHEMAGFALSFHLTGVIVASSVYATLAEQGLSSEYGLHKLAIEREFRSREGLAAVTLRLPPVYGEGLGGSIPALAALVRRGIPLPFGKATQPRDYLAASNLTDLLNALVRAAPHAWGLLDGLIAEPSDGAPVTTRDLARMIGDVLDVRTTLLPVPAGVVTALASAVGKGEMAEAAFRPLLTAPNERIGEVVGWQPRLRLPESLGYLSISN